MLLFGDPRLDGTSSTSSQFTPSPVYPSGQGGHSTPRAVLMHRAPPKHLSEPQSSPGCCMPDGVGTVPSEVQWNASVNTSPKVTILITWGLGYSTKQSNKCSVISSRLLLVTWWLETIIMQWILPHGKQWSILFLRYSVSFICWDIFSWPHNTV